MQMYTIKHYKNNKKLVVESNKKKKNRKILKVAHNNLENST